MLAPLALVAVMAIQPTPPKPDHIPHERQIHGLTLQDPFFWLRERANPKVLEHLKAENAYFDAMTAHTQGLRKALYNDMLAHIQQTDLSVPYREHGYWYYSRTVEGKPYPIHCRRKGTMEAPEEATLDVNELAAGKSFLIAFPIEVSPDSRILAYAEDPTGGRVFTVHFKDLTTGKLLPNPIENASSDLVWYNDSKTVAYTTVDAAVRSDKAWVRAISAPSMEATLVHHETDEKFGVDLAKTLDEKYILLSLRSHKTTEVRFAHADYSQGPNGFRIIEPRREGVEYQVDHDKGRFLITHNDGALNFQIADVSDEQPGRANWHTYIPHSPDVYILGTLAFKDRLVIRTREKGLPVLRIRDTNTGSEHRIEMPEPSYAADLSINTEFDSPTVRFSYSSLTTPQSIFDHDMTTRQRTLLKETPIPAYDRAKYETARLYAKASDGAEVPVAIVYKKGLKLDGSSPALLTGYGSYGINSDAGFSSNRIALLDRGLVLAIAQIRGGSEKGRAWYEDGRMMHKKNTFSDFVAAADALCKAGYTSPDHLAIRGGSAGGLLMGAVLNLRPDLCRVCIADVPFVDIINTMLDPTLPLTVEEYDQWGNPNEKPAFDYIMGYSPYDNVTRKPYPSILATVGLNDSNVPYWEGTKWVAKLRENSTSDPATHPILLHVNMDTGHGGNSDRYKRLDEEAWRYAFMLDQLGVK